MNSNLIKTVLSGIRSVLKESFSLVTRTIILVLIVELVLGLLDYDLLEESHINPIIEMTYAGGTQYRENVINKLPGCPGVLKTDSTGYIHNGQPRTKDDLYGAVFMFGGSTVEGRGSSSNKTTIPAYLEACLREAADGSLTLVNAGFSGDYSFQELLRASKSLGAYKPRLLIFLDGRNDAHFAQLADWTAYDANPGIHPPMETANMLLSISNFEFLLAGLRRYSRIVNLIVSIKEDMENSVPRASASYRDDIQVEAFSLQAQSYLFTAEAIRQLALPSKVPVLNFLQPILDEKYKYISPTEQTLQADFLLKRDLNESYFEGIRNFYEAVLKQSGMNLIDLSSMFLEHKEQLFVDTVHYNDRGNYLIAQKICDVAKSSLNW